MMNNKISREAGEKHDLLMPLLNGMYLEMQELSKKKPDTALNEYKIKAINRILTPAKELLQYEDTYPFLDILNSDDIPTNSDVILILNQYIRAMNLYKNKYFSFNNNDWRVG